MKTDLALAVDRPASDPKGFRFWYDRMRQANGGQAVPCTVCLLPPDRGETFHALMRRNLLEGYSGCFNGVLVGFEVEDGFVALAAMSDDGEFIPYATFETMWDHMHTCGQETVEALEFDGDDYHAIAALLGRNTAWGDLLVLPKHCHHLRLAKKVGVPVAFKSAPVAAPAPDPEPEPEKKATYQPVLLVSGRYGLSDDHIQALAEAAGWDVEEHWPLGDTDVSLFDAVLVTAYDSGAQAAEAARAAEIPLVSEADLGDFLMNHQVS